MRRQSRFLYVLVTAILVVAAALWLWEPPDERISDGDVIVWQVELEDVQVFALQRGDERIVIERDDTSWAMREPHVGPADASEVEYLLVNLTRLRGARPIQADDLSDFGLEPPAAVVTLTTDTGTERLVIGTEAPTGSGTYAQLSDGTVVLLSNSVFDVVDTTVQALRDRRIIRFPAGDVRRVVLTSDAGELEVTGSGTDWFVTGWGRANTVKVEDLIYSLQSTRLLSFAEDAAPDGLANPTVRVEVASADRTWRFAVGEATPMGMFVRRPDGFAGYAEPEALTYLGQGPLDLLQRAPFRLDTGVDDRIELTRGGETLVLTRDGETWSGADDAAQLVETLSNARAVYRADAVPTPAEERARVVVTRPSGRRTEVALYQRDGDSIVARDVGGGAPFRVQGVGSLF